MHTSQTAKAIESLSDGTMEKLAELCQRWHKDEGDDTPVLKWQQMVQKVIVKRIDNPKVGDICTLIEGDRRARRVAHVLPVFVDKLLQEAWVINH